MGNINGLKWALYYAEKKREKEEKKKLSREFAETQIEWELPDNLRVTRNKSAWYVNGERVIGANFSSSFVYVLIDVSSNEIRYVGLTSEPVRRYQEHRQKNRIGAQFKLRVVAFGDGDAEREWIAKCLGDGCHLMNEKLINE